MRLLRFISVLPALALACAAPVEVVESTTPSVSSEGAQLYATNCALCHGQVGEGTNQGPPLVHEIYEPSHHSDLSFWLAVQNGVPAHHWDFGPMPPIPALTESQAADITSHVRTLQEQAGIK